MPKPKKSTTPVPPVPPPGPRLVELGALLVLILLCAAVFLVAGPGALAAVTGVAAGLFATWRGQRGPR